MDSQSPGRVASSEVGGCWSGEFGTPGSPAAAPRPHPSVREERPDFCVAHTVQDFVQVLCQEESMCVWGGRGEVRREKWLPNTYPLSAYLLCEPGLIS